VWSPPIVTRCDAPEKQLVGSSLDLLDRLWNVEGRSNEIARVGDLLHPERLHVERRVVGPEQPGDLAHRRRPEARAGPERGSRVERNAGDRDVAPLHVSELRESRERGDAGEAGNFRRVHRPDRSISFADGPLLLAKRRRSLTVRAA
jgi:hypothetical protein